MYVTDGEPVVVAPGMYAMCPPGLDSLLDAGQLVIHKDNLRHKQGTLSKSICFTT